MSVPVLKSAKLKAISFKEMFPFARRQITMSDFENLNVKTYYPGRVEVENVTFDVTFDENRVVEVELPDYALNPVCGHSPPNPTRGGDFKFKKYFWSKNTPGDTALDKLEKTLGSSFDSTSCFLRFKNPRLDNVLLDMSNPIEFTKSPPYFCELRVRMGMYVVDYSLKHEELCEVVGLSVLFQWDNNIRTMLLSRVMKVA